MKIKLKVRLLCVILLFISCAARAELGGDATTIEADRAHMNAVRRALPSAQQYTVHEIQTSAGTVVREYLSAGGKVFAVAWNGPQMPDLRQLFGNYFVTFQDAAKARHTGHGPLHVEQPELVVQSGGHMRSFFGRAYLPLLVPNNVLIDEIK